MIYSVVCDSLHDDHSHDYHPSYDRSPSYDFDFDVSPYGRDYRRWDVIVLDRKYIH